MQLIDVLELKRSISASVLCDDGKGIFDIIDEQPTIELKKGRWMPHKEKSHEYIGTVLINVEYDYWFAMLAVIG